MAAPCVGGGSDMFLGSGAALRHSMQPRPRCYHAQSHQQRSGADLLPMAQTEAAQRKHVSDAIDRVLFKARLPRDVALLPARARLKRALPLSPLCCRSTSWRRSWGSLTETTTCCTRSCELPPPLPPPAAACRPLPTRCCSSLNSLDSLSLPCSNEYIKELGGLEATKDDMIANGQPVELAVELLR